MGRAVIQSVARSIVHKIVYCGHVQSVDWPNYDCQMQDQVWWATDVRFDARSPVQAILARGMMPRPNALSRHEHVPQRVKITLPHSRHAPCTIQ